jgi:phage baseplate assembly protein W
MPTQFITPIFPLRINEETGTYETLTATDITKVIDQNIKMVLLTNPGERIGIPEFGVGLYKYLFELRTEIERGSTNLPPIKNNILSQLSVFIPYIRIAELNIDFNDNKNRMNIKIKYYVVDSGVASEFDLTLSEASENLPF